MQFKLDSLISICFLVWSTGFCTTK